MKLVVDILGGAAGVSLASAGVDIAALTNALSSLDTRVGDTETTITTHTSTLSNYGGRISQAETDILDHAGRLTQAEADILELQENPTNGGNGTLIDAREFGFDEEGIGGGTRAARLQEADDAALELNAGLFAPRGYWDLGRQGTTPDDSDVKIALEQQCRLIVGDGKGITVFRQEAGAYGPGGDFWLNRMRTNGTGMRHLTLDGNRYALESADEQTHLIRTEDAHGLSFFDVELRDAFGDGIKGIGSAVTKVAATRVWQADVSGPSYSNLTTPAGDATTADVAPFPTSEAVGDFFAIGYTVPFDRIEIDCAGGTAGVDGEAVPEYFNGTDWVYLSGVGNGTGNSGATKMAFLRHAPADSLAIGWQKPFDWDVTTIGDSTPLYYVRFRLTTVYSTNPIIDRVWIASRSDSQSTVSHCDFIGIRRGGLTVQRAQSQWIILANRFADIRGQSIDFEPSGTIQGEEPLYNIIAKNIFDNSKSTAASDNDNVIALAGIGADGFEALRLLFVANQIVNGCIQIGRIRDAVIASNFIYGSPGFNPIFCSNLLNKVKFVSNFIRSTGAEAAIKAEGSGEFTRCIEVDFDDNIIESDTVGIHLQGTKDCAVTNNRIKRTGGSSTVAISLRATLADTDGAVITGNRCSGTWDIGLRINNTLGGFTGIYAADNSWGDAVEHIVETDSGVTGDIPTLGPNVGHRAPVFQAVGAQYYRSGDIIHGSGTPETFVAAPVASEYIDDDTGEHYYKTSGSSDTGWKLVTHA